MIDMLSFDFEVYCIRSLFFFIRHKVHFFFARVYVGMFVRAPVCGYLFMLV